MTGTATTSMKRMPAAFLGHGSPMNALETNRYTSAWRAFGASVPRPRAILVVSAHWYVGVTAVTAMPRPRTIHDFFGFPQKLFEIDYPAPGDTSVAQEVAEIAKGAAPLFEPSSGRSRVVPDRLLLQVESPVVVPVPAGVKGAQA